MSALSDLLKQKKQDLAAAAGRVKRVAKIPDGRSRWRILGSWRGEGQQFWHDFGQHFVKNASKQLAAIYICTEKTFGRPCAVCEAIKTGLAGATDDATMELLKEAKSGGKILVNAIQLDLPDEKPAEVQILELGTTLFEQIVGVAQEYEDNGDSLFAHDLIFTREGTGLKTKYSVMPAAASKKLPAEIKLNNLDEYVQQESEAQRNRALLSVQAVAGMLPAPTRTTGLPVAAEEGSMIVEDEYATAPVKATPAATKTVVDENPFEDVPDSVTAPAKAAAAAPAEIDPDEAALIEMQKKVEAKKKAAAAAAAKAAEAAKPAAAADSSGDPELDELLANLP